jgi:two-component system NarL family sensor kinase
VRDDGGGFDFDVIAIHPQHGIGLRNMMERMDAIGGRLAINSSAQGTLVRASVEITE